MTLKAVEPRAAHTDAKAPEPQPARAADAIDVRVPVDVRSAALTVLAVIAVILLLQYAQSMIIPIVLGVLISYALDPIVSWLERVHVPRPLGAAILLLTLVGAGGTLLYGLRFEASAIVDELPQAAKRFRRLVEADRPKTANAIQQMQKAASELEKAANSAATPPPAPSGAPVLKVEAKNIAFDTHTLQVAANTPFVIDFKNDDVSSITHDIQIRQSDGTTVVQTQQAIPGGTEQNYQYTPLPAGTYTFICSIHPVANMTGTLTVQ